MTEHVHRRCLQFHEQNVGNYVGYVGLQIMKIVQVIAPGILLHVPPQKKNLAARIPAGVWEP